MRVFSGRVRDGNLAGGSGGKVRFHHTGGENGTKIPARASNRYTIPGIGLDTYTNHRGGAIMGAVRFAKAMAAVALFNGVLFLIVREDALAGEREDDAKKYTEQLRKGKDAKAKIAALHELGTLAQIKKSLIKDALPDVYKAVEDKDAGVRAAAAETLGKADEPYDKVGDILVKLLKEDKEESVKIGALKGLTVMRENAKDALPAIREVVKATAGDKKSNLGKTAQNAAKAIAGTGKKN
jgi:hypothetical protein